MSTTDNTMKIKKLAEVIRRQIEALGDGEDAPAKVPGVFRQTQASPADKADAFWLLDEQPGMFPGRDTHWHSTLRRCRNTPSISREMFATSTSNKAKP